MLAEMSDSDHFLFINIQENFPFLLNFETDILLEEHRATVELDRNFKEFL